MGTKACAHCQQHKPLAEFPRNKSRADGYMSVCLECNRARNQRYHAEHPDRFRQRYAATPDVFKRRAAAYRKTASGKASEARSKAKRIALLMQSETRLTEAEWMQILGRYKWCCYLCGFSFTRHDPPTKDHIVPLSRGGDDSPANIAPACRSCNSAKRDETPQVEELPL